MEPKTRQEMEIIAKEMFGDDAEVSYAYGQWTISTGVEESFNIEDYKDRDAYSAYIEDEPTYGNSLLRWRQKFGYSHLSMAEVFDAWDEENDRAVRKTVSDVRKFIAGGGNFDYPGGQEYYERVMKYAEENGL